MELREQARGRWHGILTHTGIDAKYLRNRNGPCPGCGGRDRFRFDDKNALGTFFCNGGGDRVAGDGFGLLKHVFECDFPTAAKMVEDALGISSMNHKPKIPKRPPPRPKTNHNGKRLWESLEDDEFKIWDQDVADHPYARLKGIQTACGARRGQVTGSVVGRDADCIVVPLRRLNGSLVGVEVIGAPAWSDEKQKHVTPKQTFGQKGLLMLGNTLDDSLDVHITEGWADACSIWRMHGNVLVIAVFRGLDTQIQLAEFLDGKFPTRRYFVAEDG